VSPEEKDRRDKSDMQALLTRSEFTRFLFRVIQTSGILMTATDGSENQLLKQGRRNLGLEILAMVEAGQPAMHPEGLPILTLIQALREEANQPQEKPNGRRNPDRYSSDDDSDD
jgi:hypothetical protein